MVEVPLLGLVNHRTEGRGLFLLQRDDFFATVPEDVVAVNVVEVPVTAMRTVVAEDVAATAEGDVVGVSLPDGERLSAPLEHPDVLLDPDVNAASAVDGPLDQQAVRGPLDRHVVGENEITPTPLLEGVGV